jgi:hypothetical protein
MAKPILALSLLLIGALAAATDATPAAAEAPFTWEQVEIQDPERVFPSPIDPGTILVWTRDGLAVSKDDGESFAPPSPAPQLGSVTALLVDPIHPATLYAGTAAHGLFASADQGATWTALGGADQGLLYPQIQALAFATNDASFTTLYATHGKTRPGISISIDGGRTWRAFTRDYGASDIIVLDDAIFFAGANPAQGDGVFRFDPNRGWVCVLPEATNVLALSKVEAKRVWFGTEKVGVRVTDDFGISVRRPFPGPGKGNVTSIAVGFHPPRDELVCAYDPTGAGVLASSDGFKTWRAINDGFAPSAWTVAGATMAANADGSTLYACRNNELFRGRRAAGPLQLSGLRAVPAAVIADANSFTLTCRAAPGAEIKVDCSVIGGKADVALRDDGKSDDGKAGDGVYGARCPAVPAGVCNQGENQKGPRLPGQVALALTATLNGVTETGAIPLTVLRPVGNWSLWDGEYRNDGEFWNTGAVKAWRSQEAPLSPPAHVRVQVSGPGQAGFQWKGPFGVDLRNHKFITFYLRSNRAGDTDLQLALRDDARWYGKVNIKTSNVVELKRYLPRLSTAYQCVSIPLADFFLGSRIATSNVCELDFISPADDRRIYDLDELSLTIQPTPLLSAGDASPLPDGKSLRLGVCVASPAGDITEVTARCYGQEAKLFDDGQHEDGAPGDGYYAAAIPLAKAGRGHQTIDFAATNAYGKATRRLEAFVSPRPPVAIPRFAGEIRLDGTLAEFADVPSVTVGDATCSLTLRMLCTDQALFIAGEVVDPGFVLKNLPELPALKDLAKFPSVEVLITSPTTESERGRNDLSWADVRMVLAAGAKQSLAMAGDKRWRCFGAKTEKGYRIEARIPLDALPKCDFAVGRTTHVEFVLNGADGVRRAWSAPDAAATASPENWGVARFTDLIGPPLFRCVEIAGPVIVLTSDRRLDRERAEKTSSYAVPNRQIAQVSLDGDERTIRLQTDTPWASGVPVTISFPGVTSFEGTTAQPQTFIPIAGTAVGEGFLPEFLIGAKREQIDPTKLQDPLVDENLHPARGDQWKAVKTEGVFDLNQIVGPLTNAAASAHLYLFSDADRTVQFWIGSDDGVRLAVNGKAVHVNPAFRGVQADQDKVKAPLRQGWNDVMLTIAQGGGGWGFCLRLRDEQGGPPVGLRYVVDPPGP